MTNNCDCNSKNKDGKPRWSALGCQYCQNKKLEEEKKNENNNKKTK